LPLKAITFDLWQTLIWDSKELEEYRRLRRLINFQRFASKIRPDHLHKDAMITLNSKLDKGQVRQAMEEMASQLQIMHQNGLDVSPVNRGKMLFDIIGLKFKPDVSKEIYEKAGRILSESGYTTGFPNINPEAKPTMNLFKKSFPGIKIALVSNAARSAKTYERILKALGIGHYFDHLIISCEVGYLKPRREIFEEALSLLSVNPRETLHIGDLFQADVIGATSCGMNACLYTGLWDKYAQYKNPIKGIPDDFKSPKKIIVEEIKKLQDAVAVAKRIG